MKILDPQEFWDSIPDETSAAWPAICVDLNGVLDQYNGFNGKVEHYPVAEGAVEFLQGLREHFNTIIVLTATLPLDFAIEWMVQSGLDKYVDYITNHKTPAAVYVDDRAITFRGDFVGTMEEIISFQPHWSKK